MAEHCLIGKLLTDLLIAKDKKALKFMTTEGDIIAKTEGECCSETWIEHVEMPALGFPCTVIAVEDIGECKEEEWINGDDERILFYGFKITTASGDIVIDYRNSSNGYYGGDLIWPGDNYYTGVYGQNDSKLEFVPITK